MSGEGTIFRFRLKFTSDGNTKKIIQKQVNMKPKQNIDKKQIQNTTIVQIHVKQLENDN